MVGPDCRHAAETAAYNLLVKVHPLDRSYDRSASADRLGAAYASAKNIRFIRDQVAPHQLLRRCDLGITVRGTPGIEMTALGLPMILAGRSPYSDAGFCIAPTTRAEYFAILKRGPPFPIDIAEQARRARLYAAFDRHWSRPRRRSSQRSSTAARMTQVFGATSRMAHASPALKRIRSLEPWHRPGREATEKS